MSSSSSGIASLKTSIFKELQLPFERKSISEISQVVVAASASFELLSREEQDAFIYKMTNYFFQRREITNDEWRQFEKSFTLLLKKITHIQGIAQCSGYLYKVVLEIECLAEKMITTDAIVRPAILPGLQLVHREVHSQQVLSIVTLTDILTQVTKNRKLYTAVFVERLFEKIKETLIHEQAIGNDAWDSFDSAVADFLKYEERFSPSPKKNRKLLLFIHTLEQIAERKFETLSKDFTPITLTGVDQEPSLLLVCVVSASELAACSDVFSAFVKASFYDSRDRIVDLTGYKSCHFHKVVTTFIQNKQVLSECINESNLSDIAHFAEAWGLHGLLPACSKKYSELELGTLTRKSLESYLKKLQIHFDTAKTILFEPFIQPLFSQLNSFIINNLKDPWTYIGMGLYEVSTKAFDLVAELKPYLVQEKFAPLHASIVPFVESVLEKKVLIIDFGIVVKRHIDNSMVIENISKYGFGVLFSSITVEVDYNDSSERFKDVKAHVAHFVTDSLFSEDGARTLPKKLIFKMKYLPGSDKAATAERCLSYKANWHRHFSAHRLGSKANKAGYEFDFVVAATTE